jgi:hypothetical protein
MPAEIAAVIIEVMQPVAYRGALTPTTCSPSKARTSCSLEVNGIDPWHPLRPAIPEGDALQRLFREIRVAIRSHGCRRAILVGHNAAFDLGFLNAAVERTGIKRNPFHPFSCFDTATLAGAAHSRLCSLVQSTPGRLRQPLGTLGDTTPMHRGSGATYAMPWKASCAPRKKPGRWAGRTARLRRWISSKATERSRHADWRWARSKATRSRACP